MRMVSLAGWTVSGIALCWAVACGGGSSEPPPPPPEEETSGQEEPPPPPPPPPPAVAHVVHASPDPGLATFSVRLDDAPALVTDLAAGSGSGAVEIGAGTHSLHLMGVASVETGEAPEVMVTDVDVASGAHPLVLVYGEPAAEPPLAVTVLAEETTSTGTRARIVHGLVGMAAVDVCVGTTAIAAGLAPGAISSVAPIGDGAVALVVHAAHDTPCHGRAMGTAHVTTTAGGAHVATLTGHYARRRLTGSVVLCTEGADASCASATLGAR